MTNFDFLKKEKKFNSFADVAIAAEKVLHIDIGTSVINCRRAMEFAIKWMYSVDDSLIMPYQDTLVTLMSTDEFRDIVGNDNLKRLTFIRKAGNNAAHKGKSVNKDQAVLCLENLHSFMDFIAYCYADHYEETKFNPELLYEQNEKPADKEAFADITLKELMAENEALKAKLTEKGKEKRQTYVSKPVDLSEYKTRKQYIDVMLVDAGWIEGKDWINEVELKGMPNKSGIGYADYVLYDDAHRPLAVIEAKRTCGSVVKGRQQAKLYADILEKKYKRRPVVFLTNGFETRIIDNKYPERRVAAFYSKRDLEKWFNIQTMREDLSDIVVDRNIADRYYQEGAVKAICESLDQKNRRKALLVMATGSGKTRTVIALCDVLLKKGWVKNILFLADRNSLVTQAKRSFVNLLPDLSATNLCEEKSNYSAHCVFSTYQTMIHCIDSIKDDEGRLFTCGHFDLVICDEAHRSIYNKYKDIFTYFDAPLVGLTATPKDEIEKNTYDIFELENGVPTYGYDLAQAVKDGYLVDYMSVETELKFLEQGISYEELSEEEKIEYENTFSDEDGNIPEKISSSALNSWVFNEDTIKKALHILMKDGIKINYGETLGKTIIFARNHEHAEKIYEIFGREFPHLVNYAKVIDNYTNYVQSAIDEFSEPNKLPQIAISVDMLDTGIDIPEVLNLVFFKKVMSKAKFWQMIGRGTRKCAGLIDGEDKNKFYIFDFCGNFEFFRINKDGKPTANMIALQSVIFNLEFQMAHKLQDIQYQTEGLTAYRESLVQDMSSKVCDISRDNFIAKQHIKYIDTYSDKRNYETITFEDTLNVKEELAPLINPDKDEISAVRFDALVYALELAYLAGKPHNKGKGDLIKKVKGISSVANIPEIKVQYELIDDILNKDYLEHAGIKEFECIRENLRSLMKYLPKGKAYIYDTNFSDDILSEKWKDSELENDDLEQYKLKAAYYIRQNQDNIVISKLKMNKPITKLDIESLEKMLQNEVGSEEEYKAEFGNKPLGEFVREIVGLDMGAAKEAFAEFLYESRLDSRQIYFVNQIVEYIVHNGLMKDRSIMRDTPFTDKGNIVELFGEDMRIWGKIVKAIDAVNENAIAI